jgi:hypothetical protein
MMVGTVAVAMAGSWWTAPARVCRRIDHEDI